MFLCSAVRHVGQRPCGTIVLTSGAVRAGGNVKTMAQETYLLVKHEVVDDMKGKVSQYNGASIPLPRPNAFASFCAMFCNISERK